MCQYQSCDDDDETTRQKHGKIENNWIPSFEVTIDIKLFEIFDN